MRKKKVGITIYKYSNLSNLAVQWSVRIQYQPFVSKLNQRSAFTSASVPNRYNYKEGRGWSGGIQNEV